LELFFLFILFLFIIYLLSQTNGLKREIDFLDSRIRNLESDIKKEKFPEIKTNSNLEPAIKEKPNTKTEETKPVQLLEVIPEKTVAKIESKALPVIEKTKENLVKYGPREPSVLLKFWKKIEKPILENWTGILGAVILVAGISFLGIYALFIITPFFRCLLVLVFASLLFGLSIWLEKKIEFRTLSLALRSSAAAVFLFISLGSTYIEALKWLENSYVGLFVLALGILVNLWAGYRTKNESFASLHTILGLVSISIPQASQLTLGVTSIICLSGVIWNYLERRELHLLIVSTGFFISHMLWNHHFYYGFKPVGIDVAFPIISILPVFCGALLVHYRETLYGKKDFELLPFISHLLNWSYLAISLVQYSQNSKYITIVMLLAAGAVWYLSRNAKRKEINWLFLTDRLVSQSMIMFAIFSLHLWNLGNLSMLSILALEILIFSWVCFQEDNRFLERVSLSLTTFVFGILIFISYKEFFQSPNQGAAIPEFLTSQIGFGLLNLMLVGFIAALERKFQVAKQELSLNSAILTLLGLLAGLGFYSLYLSFHQETFGIWIPVLSLSFILIFREKLLSKKLLYSIWVLTLLVTLTVWKSIAFTSEENAEKILMLSVPWLLPFLVYLKNCNIGILNTKVYWPGIIGFTAHFVITFYFYLNLKSSLLFGPFVILLSLTYLEFGKWSHRLERKKTVENQKLYQSFYILAFILVGIFLIRHITVEFQAQTLLFGISARFWIEMLASCLFLYWVLFPEDEFSSVSWLTSAQPLFWELLILISVIAVYTEIPQTLISFAISLTTVLLFILSRIKLIKAQRFAFYVYFFFIWTNLEIFIGGESTIYVDQNELPWKQRGFQIASIFVQLGSIFFILPKLTLDGLESQFFGWTQVWKKVLQFFQRYSHLLPGYLCIFGVIISVFIYAKDFISPISNLLVGPTWALLSVFFLEMGQLFGRNNNSHSVRVLSDFIKRASWFGLIAFSGHYVFVDLQSSHIIFASLTAAQGIGLLGFLIWLYWANSNIIEKETVSFWKTVDPLLAEGSLLFTGIIFYSSFNDTWVSVYFAIAALFVLEIGIRKTKTLSRFRWYGIVLHLLACFYLTFIISNEDNPISQWYLAKWIPGVLTILLLFLFVFRAYLGYGKQGISFPRGLGFLNEVSVKTGKHLNGVVYYPFFVGIFLFLYWSFSSAVLTLLWSLLAFLIFLLGLVLKESMFRYLSLGLLLFCVGRLVIHDLSSAEPILRAVVFLGVGSILLLMNTIYNKYRDRF